MNFLVNLKISVFLLFTLSVFSTAQTQDNLAKKQSENLGVGLINTDLIQCSFLNNGDFSDIIYRNNYQLSGITHNNISYIDDLDLWLGIPEGDWTPKTWNANSLDSIKVGPTVSGTFFYYYGSYPGSRTSTDWGAASESRGTANSGDLLLSDLYTVSSTNDFPLLANREYPLTWPENIYGDRIWPGKWKSDPVSGEIINNKFRADQEVFFEFTDTEYANKIYPINIDKLKFMQDYLRGYDIGAKVTGNILAFNDTYANDILFVDLNIENTTKWNYHDVYLGLYFYPYVNRDDMEPSFFNDGKNKDYIGYIRGEFNHNLQQFFQYNLSYYYFEINPTPPRGQCYYVGMQLLETPYAPLNNGKDDDGDGIVDEAEGEQTGLTGWHYFNDKAEYDIISVFGGADHIIHDHPLKRGELIQYKIMAGDTSNLRPIEFNRFFHSKTGMLNPNFDDLGDGKIKGIVKVLLSSGPFNWNSGESVKFSFAVVFGKDLKDLKSNCRVAQKMYDNDYRRMEAPVAPTVSAVTGNEQVTLYWDDAAEKSTDFLTDYLDFEGYRIYRTTVDPVLNQWGEQTKDGDGNLVGFLPVAQFDLINDITGLDQQYPHLELGFDTGIQHSWTDTTVKNGITYWYAVCAYDRGISADSLLNPNGWPLFKSLENNKGRDANIWRNLVKVIPGALPSNYQNSRLSLMPLPGSKGNGPIFAEIIDPAVVTGHTYTLLFNDTSTAELNYSIFDEVTNQYVLQQVSHVHGEEGPIFDGIRLSVNAFDVVGLYADSSGWFSSEIGDSSDCNFGMIMNPLLQDPVLYNYEIRFTELGDTSYIFHKFAPFELWNISQQRKMEWEIFTDAITDTTDSLRSTWSPGDIVRVREIVNDVLKFSWDFTLFSDPKTVYIERDTLLDGYPATVIDTLIISNPPKTGDIARFVTTKPFHSGDRFCLQTFKAESHKTGKDELVRIKVVPNPYLVTAAWEQHSEDHRLAFTHLPANCQVIIFNVTGDVVAVLSHDNLFSGTMFWNLQSHEGMEVASGLYVYVVKTAEGKTKDGKFVVIR